MAKKLGLHIESDPSTIQLAEEEIEQRRTIWWSCRFLDLYVLRISHYIKISLIWSGGWQY